MSKFKTLLLFTPAFTLMANFLFLGCKKDSGQSSTSSPQVKYYITDTLAGRYLVSGTYGTSGVQDTQFNIPPSILYVIKIDSIRLRISFQPYFTFDSCAIIPYGGSLPWVGTIIGSDSLWYNNIGFTVHSFDSITIIASSGFNSGPASAPYYGGYGVSGYKLH